MTAQAKALASADLRALGVPARLVKAMVGASPGYASTASNLTPGERALIDSEKAKLADFHNRRAHNAKADREVEDLVARDPERAFKALERLFDRMTSPTKQSAE